MMMNLSYLIRFPYLTCKQLNKVLKSENFEKDFITNTALEAFSFKTGQNFQQKVFSDHRLRTKKKFVPRNYIYKSVKVVEHHHIQSCTTYVRDQTSRVGDNGCWTKNRYWGHLLARAMFLPLFNLKYRPWWRWVGPRSLCWYGWKKVCLLIVP